MGHTKGSEFGLLAFSYISRNDVLIGFLVALTAKPMASYSEPAALSLLTPGFRFSCS